MKTQLPQITRRAFAFGISAAGGGLILGVARDSPRRKRRRLLRLRRMVPR